MKKMYVGNIAFNATEQDLRELFSEYGEIGSLKIIKDNFTNQSRGFGFVEMIDENDAQKAITALNGKTFKGKILTVAEAKPQQRQRGFRDKKSSYGKVQKKSWR